MVYLVTDPILVGNPDVVGDKPRWLDSKYVFCLVITFATLVRRYVVVWQTALTLLGCCFVLRLWNGVAAAVITVCGGDLAHIYYVLVLRTASLIRMFCFIRPQDFG
jgi:hypothetical protein